MPIGVVSAWLDNVRRIRSRYPRRTPALPDALTRKCDYTNMPASIEFPNAKPVTTTIRITLGEHGVWTTNMGFPAVVGVPLDGRSGWAIANALAPQVEDWLRNNGLDDALVQAIDPNGTDLGGVPCDEELCSFRLVDGVFSVQV